MNIAEKNIAEKNIQEMRAKGCWLKIEMVKEKANIVTSELNVKEEGQHEEVLIGRYRCDDGS